MNYLHALAALICVSSLQLVQPIMPESEEQGGPKMNQVEKSVDGLLVFTARIPASKPAGEKVPLVLELKNSGKGILVFNDFPFRTFSIQVKGEDGMAIPMTRYGKWLTEARKMFRDVDIELAPGKKASVTIPLERVFDLSERGNYRVVIEASYSVMNKPGKVALEKLPLMVDIGAFPRIKGD